MLILDWSSKGKRYLNLAEAKKLFSKMNSTKMDEEPTDNDPESMPDELNQNKKSNHHKESTLYEYNGDA